MRTTKQKSHGKLSHINILKCEHAGLSSPMVSIDQTATERITEQAQCYSFQLDKYVCSIE